MRWIDVEERRPKYGAAVLFTDGDAVYSGVYRLRGGVPAWHAYTGSDITGVTHWMEPPELPREVQL